MDPLRYVPTEGASFAYLSNSPLVRFKPNSIYSYVPFSQTRGGQNGKFTFTPDANYYGPAVITYTVTDTGDPVGTAGNTLTSAPATVTVTAVPPADGPGFPLTVHAIELL